MYMLMLCGCGCCHVRMRFCLASSMCCLLINSTPTRQHRHQCACAADCPAPARARLCLLRAVINSVRTRGESCGGVVTCVVRGCPKGLGSPVFDKLEAELAKAMLSLPATKVRSSAFTQPAAAP